MKVLLNWIVAVWLDVGLFHWNKNIFQSDSRRNFHILQDRKIVLQIPVKPFTAVLPASCFALVVIAYRLATIQYIYVHIKVYVAVNVRKVVSINNYRCVLLLVTLNSYFELRVNSNKVSLNIKKRTWKY